MHITNFNERFNDDFIIILVEELITVLLEIITMFYLSAIEILFIIIKILEISKATNHYKK